MHSDHIEIIRLRSEHCERVYDISAKYIPEHWSLDGIKDVLRYDNNIYYVAMCHRADSGFDKTEVVGFGGIMIVADEAELLNIAIEEAYRKQGIAGRILDKLIDEAKLAQCTRMLLEVRKANETAQRFYRDKGFDDLGIRKNYYVDPTDDAIIMDKVLG